MEEHQEHHEKDRAERLKEGYEHLKGEAQAYQEKARESYKQLRDRVDHYRSNANDFLDQTTVYMKENPQRSSMIAALGGLVVGLFMGLLIRGGHRD